MKFTFGILVAVLFLGSSAYAQGTQVVLGVGRIGFDVGSNTEPVTQAQAQGQKYRVYTATGTTVVVTATCGVPNNGVVSCNFPIAQIPGIPTSPSASLGFSVTAEVTAADGVLETARVTAPFTLQKAAPPAAPRLPMSILPAIP